jgi:drug/metabolite transporter (DMT)-like permease
MFVGLLFAIGACFVWGLIFIVPQYLGDYSAVEVVLGRYLSYGLLSALLFFRTGFKRVRRYHLREWVIAFVFALFSNLVYYLSLVAGLRFATPTLAVLIVGMAPIVIAFYGNWQAREMSYRNLAIPCLWIGFGLILVNATEVDWSFQAQSIAHYLLGIAGILIALLSWSWCAVHNARFLKKNPHIAASEWSTLMGVATLFWAILIGGVFAIGLKNEVNILKFLSLSPDALRYFAASALLGVVCSWLGCFLWSQASLHLPISLMGPLLIFETLFGLFFVYLFQKQLPSWIELLGVCSMIGGIVMSVNSFRKKRLFTR